MTRAVQIGMRAVVTNREPAQITHVTPFLAGLPPCLVFVPGLRNCRIGLYQVKARLRRIGGLRAALARRPRPPTRIQLLVRGLRLSGSPIPKQIDGTLSQYVLAVVRSQEKSPQVALI